MQAMCVASSTFGCRGSIKQNIEKTFMSVNSIMHKKCTPPPAPKPSMQCTVGGEETRGCDHSKASECMYELYNDLTCTNPDFKKICP